MKTISFNGVEIAVVANNGSHFIPVKPICQAVGVDFDSQRHKIEEHPILSPVAVLSTATGADGKRYEMFCLPVKYVYGWLFTINPGRVSPDARTRVLDYCRECFEVLYEHFHYSLDRQLKANEEEITLLKEIAAAAVTEKEARNHRRSLEERLDKLRAKRLDPRPELPLE